VVQGQNVVNHQHGGSVTGVQSGRGPKRSSGAKPRADSDALHASEPVTRYSVAVGSPGRPGQFLAGELDHALSLVPELVRALPELVKAIPDAVHPLPDAVGIPLSSSGSRSRPDILVLLLAPLFLGELPGFVG
jgi:hypothetical protein